MRLTLENKPATQPSALRRQPHRVVTLTAIAAAIAVVFALDRLTGIPHVQHLYYFPIIVAAIRFGMVSGMGTAVVAIVLYHLANPQTLTLRYEEFDIVQMAIFVAAAVVAARLADDARRLRTLAMTDDLTGLHNLRSFELELRAIVANVRRTRSPVSLLVLDLDRLKSLNDEHGHLAGAEAVRAVGRIIADQLPSDAVACRYGGDEFVVALPHATAAAAQRVANDLRCAVEACAPVLAGIRFPAGRLSISVGIACRVCGEPMPSTGRRGDDEESEALFRAADAALYAAKNGGRNQVQIA